MQLVIRGHHLPGLHCGSYSEVHVGLQLRSEPAELVPADAENAEWTTDISVADDDFRGPAVQGKRGDRFVYLTWGEYRDGSFTMFRRAKLMLNDLGTLSGAARVGATVHLTDEAGLPRCARLRSPAIHFRAERPSAAVSEIT